jgi:Flp pilus assembly protein TadG
MPLQPDAPTRRARTRRWFRRDDGSALVEFALISPLVIMLVFGVIEFGIAYNQQIEVRSAAREGGRMAAVDNGCGNGVSCPSATTQRDNLIAATRTKAAGLADSSAIKVSVSYTGTTVGTDTVTVCLNYTMHSATLMFQQWLDNVVIKGKAVMRLEQVPTFAPGNDGVGPATCP